jgi:hypothetical protein
VIKLFFYIYFISLFLLISCSNNPDNKHKRTESPAASTRPQTSSEFKLFSILSRELQQESDTLFADEDCFCSNRVMFFDTAKLSLSVFSWCQYKESPENDPDFGTYKFEKILSDSAIQFSGTPGTPTEFSCIQIKTSGTDSVMTLKDCDSQKLYFFTSMRLLQNYEIRIHDCSDVQG